MVKTAELAERLDVRLHTHLAEDADEDTFAAEKFGCRTVEHFEAVGWMSDRSWVAHCIFPNDGRDRSAGCRGRRCRPLPELEHDGRRRRCLAPVAELRAAGVKVGLGCDGSASADAASLWMEARNAMLLGAPARSGRHRPAPATRWRSPPAAARAASVARVRSVSSRSGAVGDLVCWPLEGVRFAGAISDPIDAWLRCGPVDARHTVVAGRSVRDGRLESNRRRRDAPPPPPPRGTLPAI